MTNLLLYLGVGILYTLLSLSYANYLIKEENLSTKAAFRKCVIEIPLLLIFMTVVGWIIVNIARFITS